MLEEKTSPEMRERLSEMSVQRPDIETLGWIPGPRRMLGWLHTGGVASGPALGYFHHQFQL